MSDCIFCKIIRLEEHANVVAYGPSTYTIVPLNPVVEGHVITISREHVSDFSESARVSAGTMNDAAHYAKVMQDMGNLGDFNIIVNNGPAATQSVYHLHVHVIPRVANDGLALPWYSGKENKL